MLRETNVTELRQIAEREPRNRVPISALIRAVEDSNKEYFFKIREFASGKRVVSAYLKDIRTYRYTIAFKVDLD